MGDLEAPRIAEGSLMPLDFGFNQCSCLNKLGCNQQTLSLLPPCKLLGNFLLGPSRLLVHLHGQLPRKTGRLLDADWP